MPASVLTSVGDKLEDYQSTVKGKLDGARAYVASDGTVAMVLGLVLGIHHCLWSFWALMFYTDFADANVGRRYDLDPRSRLWAIVLSLHLPPLTRRRAPRWRLAARRSSIGSRISRA